MRRGLFKHALVLLVVGALECPLALAQGTASPLPPVVQGPATLRNFKGASVFVDYPASEFRTSMEGRLAAALTAAGIEVLARGEHPVLRLNVSTRRSAVTQDASTPLPYMIYALELEVRQLVTLPGTPARRAGAAVWDTRTMAWALESQWERTAVGDLNTLLTGFRDALAESRVVLTTAAPARSIAPPPITDGEMRYGKVPPDFVPPIPDGLARDLTITMDKSVTGALTTVGIYHFNGNHVKPESDAFDGEDYLKVMTDVITATKSAPGLNFLLCEYLGDETGPRRFWFKQRPPAALDAAQLARRLRNHPMLVIGPPRTQCPATLDDALTALRADK
jgi:hypothetical protein